MKPPGSVGQAGFPANSMRRNTMAPRRCLNTIDEERCTVSTRYPFCPKCNDEWYNLTARIASIVIRASNDRKVKDHDWDNIYERVLSSQHAQQEAVNDDYLAELDEALDEIATLNHDPYPGEGERNDMSG